MQIRKEGSSYNLIRDGEPYFIKGAVDHSYMEKLQEHGANSVRIWHDHKQKMDLAFDMNLTVLVSLPFKAERNGMDYDNPEMVEEQFEKTMELVESLKDHPAVLMWAVGNELDYIPGTLPYKLSVWNAVNDVTKAIHEIDPLHPVMTVIGTSRFEKIKDLKERAPDLDLLGVNAYGDMPEMPSKLEENGWEKPYVFTEWGVSGYWEVPRTSWNAPYEENTSVKAKLYQYKYSHVVLGNPGKCLGSYVFLWGWKQETTHTWFGMIDEKGRESEAVEVMQIQWTGEEPNNHAPRIDSMTIDRLPYLSDIILMPGSTHEAAVISYDPDEDPITLLWEIRPEAKYAAYAGQGEVTPPVIDSLINVTGIGEISFQSPDDKGAYRLYVYLYDDHNHYSTANKPFYVSNPEDE